MIKRKNNTLVQRLYGVDPNYICLFLALGLEFLLMAFRGYSFYFLDNYMIVPCMLFLGIGLTRKETTSCWQLWLGLAAAAWFFIVQMLHFAMDMEVRNAGLFFSVYLLAFPFAAIAGDGKKQTGLKMAAAAYIGAALVLVAFTGLLLLDALPGFLQPHVYWDGARLQAMWHPNICASIFMIAIAFCLGLSSLAREKWAKALCLCAAALFFATMALTNSRTSIIMTCVIIGGFLFFAIWKGGWKRFLAGAVAALAAIYLLFSAAGALFDLHNELLVEKYLRQQEAVASESVTVASDSETVASESAAETNGTSPVIINESTGEVSLETDAIQHSLSHDMRTLNGRTLIWEAALTAIEADPSILLLGVDYPANIISEYHYFTVAHAHNSWVETLLGLGLPGLLAALIVTGIAAWNILVILFGKDTDLWQKVIALLVLCLMGAGILEPYLFFSDRYYHYTDFLFFLCLGYMTQWRKGKKAEQ